MYRRNRGSTILIIIIAIAALLLSVMGATFAYFTANINLIDTQKEVVTKSQVLEIMFRQKNEVIYKDLMPGRPGYESQAINKNRNSVSFTVQSTEAVTLRTPYKVYFVIENNTFGKSTRDSKYTNIVYTLNGTAGKCPKEFCPDEETSNNLDSIIGNSCNLEEVNCGNGQYFNADNSILHQFEGDKLRTKLGQIPYNESGEEVKIEIGGGVVGAHGAKDEWTFELWINEVGDEQNYDQGKFIKGHLEIDTDDAVKYSNEPSQFKTP